MFFGLLGSAIQPYSPLVAIGLALVLPPILAFATKGRYYLRRTDDGIDLPMYDEHGNPSDAVLTCHVCRQEFERPDMVGLRHPRRRRLLAVPEHRQAQGPRAPGAVSGRRPDFSLSWPHWWGSADRSSDRCSARVE